MCHLPPRGQFFLKSWLFIPLRDTGRLFCRLIRASEMAASKRLLHRIDLLPLSRCDNVLIGFLKFLQIRSLNTESRWGLICSADATQDVIVRVILPPMLSKKQGHGSWLAVNIAKLEPPVFISTTRNIFRCYEHRMFVFIHVDQQVLANQSARRSSVVLMSLLFF